MSVISYSVINSTGNKKKPNTDGIIDGEACQKNNRNKKKISECRRKIKIDLGGSKIQKVKIWQYIFYWWEPGGQEKFNFFKEKFKIRCLYTQLNFIQG